MKKITTFLFALCASTLMGFAANNAMSPEEAVAQMKEAITTATEEIQNAATIEELQTAAVAFDTTMQGITAEYDMESDAPMSAEDEAAIAKLMENFNQVTVAKFAEFGVEVEL